LLLAVALGGFGMGEPVVLLVIGVGLAPLAAAVPNHLGVFRVTFNLPSVVVAAALPLTIGMATKDLFRMKTGRLERLLTVAAPVIAHQENLDLNSDRSVANPCWSTMLA
jgi:hypothetical protein